TTAPPLSLHDALPILAGQAERAVGHGRPGPAHGPGPDPARRPLQRPGPAAHEAAGHGPGRDADGPAGHRAVGERHRGQPALPDRSEEHTSELQSLAYL